MIHQLKDNSYIEMLNVFNFNAMSARIKLQWKFNVERKNILISTEKKQQLNRYNNKDN